MFRRAPAACAPIKGERKLQKPIGKKKPPGQTSRLQKRRKDARFFVAEGGGPFHPQDSLIARGRKKGDREPEIAFQKKAPASGRERVGGTQVKSRSKGEASHFINFWREGGSFNSTREKRRGPDRPGKRSEGSGRLLAKNVSPRKRKKKAKKSLFGGGEKSKIFLTGGKKPNPKFSIA